MECETKLCKIRKRSQAHQIYINTYGKEPNEEELKEFIKHLESRGWK